MYEAAASCKDTARTPVTNWEPQCVTLAGYCYKDTARTPVTNWEPQCVTLAGNCYDATHGMKGQLVTPYRVSHLQRYGVTVRGNVTSVYPS